MFELLLILMSLKYTLWYLNYAMSRKFYTFPDVMHVFRYEELRVLIKHISPGILKMFA